MPSRRRTQPDAVASLEPAPPWFGGALGGWLLVGLAFVVYAPVLGGGFIWDDGRAITNNPAFASPHPLADIWAGRGDADYFPLKTTILWLIHLIAGSSPAPYHVANVAFHAICAGLVWRVLRRLAIPGAWLGGLIFLIHPTHVESVAWVSECKNTLSTLFGLLAVLAWLAFESQGRARHYLGALGLFVAGLLCKTHLVILPAALVLCAYWTGRAGAPSVSGRQAAAVDAAAWRWRLVRRVAPFFVVAACFGALTVHFQYGRAIGDYQLPVGGLASRVANAGKATWWYLGKSISPINPWYEMPSRPVESLLEGRAVLAGTRAANPAPAVPIGRPVLWPLCAIYPRWRVTAPVWYDYLPLVALVGLLALAVRFRRGRGRGACFALAYFVVALLPVVGLFKMSYMRAAWVADHFQYLADIGVSALGAAAGTLLWRRAGARRWLVVGAGGALLASFAVGTAVRAAAFRSEYSLWSDTVAKNPEAVQAQIRLGAVLLGRNDPRGAAAHFAQGVRWKPDDAEAHNNLGIALCALGRTEEGIAHYREAIRLGGGQFFAYANLGDALAGQKRHAEAVAAYGQAIRANPRLAPLHYRQAMSLIEIGQLDEARQSLERADALAPRDPQVAAAQDRLRHLQAAGR
jgi:Flp pilus assembly protein TadD